MNNHLYKKNDLTLLGVLLLLALLCTAIYFLYFHKQGSLVLVTVDGSLYGEYSLNEDLILDLGTNRLQIQNGRVSMLEADCPDLICVHHKAISRTGETIICLPNRIIVQILGEPDTSVPDAVSQ